MDNLTGGSSLYANVFHAGNTCPFCQESIVEGQLIVRCSACGSLQHESCWRHKGGCASYHCDTEVTSNRPLDNVEIVLTASEVDKVIVPTKPKGLAPEQVAQAYLPKKPDRLSRLSVVSAALAGLALAGLAGIFLKDSRFLALGIAVAIASAIIGVIALAFINMRKRLHGMVPAGIGTMLSTILIIGYFIAVAVQHQHTMGQVRFNPHLVDSRPEEADLLRLQAPVARALRANVVIQTRNSKFLTGSMVFGSGVILKIVNHRAWIMTNRHVIRPTDKDAKEVRVLFYNGEESVAKIEMLTPDEVDIAIISCEALTQNHYESIIPSDTPSVQGERVFAIGNPMGLSWSYTEGVISSTRQQMQGDRTLNIYQTQTPINSGNSGGGLYAMDGSLIGINTWKQDASVAEGLNFAIAMPSILELFNQQEKSRFFDTTSPESEP